MIPTSEAFHVATPRRVRRLLLATTALVAAVGSVTGVASAQDLPTNGQVVAGAATVQTAGRDMTVTTTTQRTVIDWSSFSVATDHRLTFNQPDAASIAVNRVTGADPSKIFGTISSNGRVVIANPNGIWFGPSARVDVAGVVASAGRIGDDAVGRFMAGGALTIDAGNAGASVVNDGIITARDGGFAGLVAPGVRNSGTITARLGRVALASGRTTTVDFYGDGLINLAVVGTTASAPFDSAVTNAGAIYAEGGQVRLSASVAEGLLNTVINMSGVIEAKGVSTAGGVVELLGGTGSIDLAGRVDVAGIHGRDGGRIGIQAGAVGVHDGVLNLTGSLDAGSVTGKAGAIEATARFAYLGGNVGANGATGGTVAVSAVGITQGGTVSATGNAGSGGTVALNATQNITQTARAITRADSATGAGGTVQLHAGAAGRVFSSGTLTATGATGGTVQVLGKDIILAAATADARGLVGTGGAVLVGGDLHGSGPQTAATVTVNGAVTLRADGGRRGDGGRVVVWSDDKTDYQGSATARGGALAGNGGLIEVSSANLLTFGGSGDASAVAGKAGALLLDPKNIVISETTGGLAVFDLFDPNAGIGTGFGDTTTQLGNGTIAITKPGDTVGGAANAGSVYYYDPYNGALLSTFQGSHTGDRVGSGVGSTTGLKFLDPNAGYDPVSYVPTQDSSKAYLIHSPSWNGQAGALTWVAGNGMASGIVGSANSLVGATANDRIGSMDSVGTTTIDILANGNVLVRSPNWSDGRGALTFMNAATGLTGTVSVANSLVGTRSSTMNANGRRGDSLGSDGIVTLANGDFVVRSGYWDRMGGALTYGSATTGFGAVGALGSGNSLIGNGGVTYSATNQLAYPSPTTIYGFYNGDNVGSAGITQLVNGDLVIASPNWGHGRGAVTYASGAAGLTGTVSTGNSLVGTTKGIGDTSDGTSTYFTDLYGNRGWYGGDAVGSGGVTELANHGFVISSPNWSTNRGATTYFASGTTALSGSVGNANSLRGSTAGTATGYDGFHRQSISGGDMVGAVTALANGNYAVSTTSWNGSRGSVTLMDGTTGQTLTGSNGSRGDVVSAANSLVGGTAGDQVGTGIVKLAGTSDIVVASREWGGGKGAVTRVSGTTGVGTAVSASNSLVGTIAYEQASLGGDNIGGSVVALPNGAYVILSPNWNKTRGAATFVAAGGAITGNVSSANSLVGTTGAEGNAVYCNTCNYGNAAIFGGDLLGSGGITVLNNGNFLLASPNWSQQRGAMTFVNGTTGALVDGTASLTGSVSATNSLVGTQAATRYVSAYNYSGLNAVGLRYWVGGDRVGSVPESGYEPAIAIGTDRFLLSNTNWHNMTGALTLGKTDGTFATGGVFAGQVSAANSLVGSTASTIYTPSDLTQSNYSLQYNGDRLGSDGLKMLADGRIAMFSPYWSGTRGAMTLMSGTTGLQGTVGAANSLVGTLAGDSIGSGGTYYTYELANGKTVFVNQSWNGTAGAVTELAAGASLVGAVDSSNSLVGAMSGDYLGSNGVVLLPGNRYIINSVYASGGQSAITYHDGTTPLIGMTTPRNTFFGDVNTPTSAGLGYQLTATGSLLMNFSAEGSGRVTLGFNDPTGWTYARAPQSTLTIAPSLIEKSLNSGTSLILQASNDITLNDAIAAAANATGNLTLEAGRSIIANADIGLGAGSLTLLANNSAANGVIDAQRDAGNAVITLTNGAINTTGAVSIKLAASTDKTNNAAGGIALGTINAGSVDVRNLGSAGGSLTLGGAITATGGGTSILLATGGAFINNAGASALSAGAGRFLVYSADPRNNTLGGLTADGKFYGRTLAANPPSSLSATDDLFLYSVVPVLTVTGNTTVGYGDAAGSVTPTISGFIDGDTRLSAVTGAATTSTLYQAGDAVGGSYALTVGQGTLASSLGYAFNLVNGTVSVTPKLLTLALTGTVGKQYDRTTTATLTQGNYQLAGLYGTDSITVGNLAGSYASANVGTNLNVSVSLAAGDFTAGAGTTLSNYVLPTGVTAAGIGTITARPLSLSGVTATDRTYDGTTAVALSGGTLAGVVSGDTIGFTAGTGVFADRNVGIGKAVSLSGYTLTGAAAGNYTLAQPGGLTATVTARSLNLTGVTAQGRAYDGTTAVTLSGGALSGVLGSDAVGLTGGTGTVMSRNVGTQTVTATGYGLSGADAGNYVLAGQPTGLSATIFQRVLNLTGVNAQDRAYDGTTAVALSGGTLGGVIGGDAVGLTGGTGVAASRNVGTRAVTVTGYGLTGADAANYMLAGQPTGLSVAIAQRAVNLIGVTAQVRAYDGTTTVALSGGSVTGVLGSDVVSLTGGSGSLADRNVGVGKAVTVTGFGLSGADAGNYLLTGQPTGLTATITAKSLNLTGVTAQNRAYDGTTTVALAGGSVTGVLGGDVVGLTGGSGSLADRNAGVGKAVTVTGYGLSGADAGNYALAGQPAGLTATVTARSLNLTGVTVQDRAYDGTTAVVLSGGTLSGLIGADAVSLTGGTGVAASRNAGTRAVTVTGYGLTGVDAANYMLAGQPTGLSVAISQRAVSLTGVTAQGRAYDGTTAVALAGGSVTGILGSDAVSLTSGSGSLADSNAGVAKAVTVTGFGLSGADAGNYVLMGQPTGLTATVTARSLNLTGVTAQGRAYDGTTAVALSGGTLGGVLGADAVALIGGTGVTASRNAGTHAVTVTGYGLTGADAANYMLAGQPTGLSVAIAQRVAALSGVTTVGRSYDGTTAVALTSGSVTGLLGGDAVTLVQGSGTLADGNAGLGRTVAVTGFGLSGADAANYALGGVPSSLTVDIAARSLNLTGVTAQGRAYDGTSAVTLSGGTLTGVVSGDSIGFSAGTGSFADRNVGVGKAVTLSGYTLTGAGAGNYVLSQPTGLTATMTARLLTLGGVSAQDRTYDGTTNVALSGGTLTGVVGSDAVALTGGSASLADRNVGVGKAVTVTGFGLSGADAANYTLAGQPTGLSVSIAQRAVTLSGVTTVGRSYDGTTAVALTGGSVTGLLGGDAVTLVQGSGALADSNAGMSRTVAVTGFGLSGADAANYALSGVPSSLTVDIAARTLSLTGVTAQGRAYDGTTNVALTGGTLTGIVGADAVALTGGTGTAASRNVGTRAVTVTGYGLNGADAANYMLAGQPTGLSVAIAQRAVTLSGVSAQGRVYDGTTAVALSGGNVSGLIGSDAVALVQGSGTLADRHAGTGKTVTVTGFGLSGVDAANYVLGGVPSSLTVDIATRAVSLTGVTAQGRAYDGTTLVALSGGTFSGVAATDAVTLTGGTGSLADRNVGTAKAVTVTGFGLGGADAGNYTLTGQPAGLTATVAARTLDVTGLTAQGRAYDGTTAVTLSGGTLRGVVGSDAVALTGGTGTAASRNAGTLAVTVTGFGLTGADAANYTLAGQPSGLSVAIDPARLSVTLAAGSVSKTYDGTASAALVSTSYRINGVVAGETISIGNTAGSFAGAGAGTGLTVAVGLAVGDYVAGAGTSLGNYALPTGTVSAAAGTILPAALLVRADDVTRMAGDPMPTLNASITGFVGSDTAASTGLAPVLTTSAVAQSAAGSYAINAAGGQLRNYVVTYRAGTMTVTPAPVPVPLQALVTMQPVQSIISAPATTIATSGEVVMTTGLAKAFMPTASGVGTASSMLAAPDQSARGANDYANSFLSSIQLESRK